MSVLNWKAVDPQAASSRDSSLSSDFLTPEFLAEVTRHLASTAADYDRARTFPHENLRYLHQQGLLSLTVPRVAGGAEINLDTARRVVAAIAKGEPSTALIVIMQYLFVQRAAHSKTWPAHLREQVLRGALTAGTLGNGLRVEPELGTPARGGLPAATARRVPGGWAISARKIFSTGAPALAWMGVWAKTDDPQPRVGTFLVPAGLPGITIEETWDHLGMRCSGSHDVIFDNVLVPEDHAVDVHPPAHWAQGFSAVEAGWIGVLMAALYQAVAENARDWLVRFLIERKPSNLGASLSTLPRFQEALGEIEVLLYNNRILIDSMTQRTDDGQSVSTAETGYLKLLVTRNAIQVASKALELTGNHGLSTHNTLERYYRDILCGRVHTPQSDTVLIGAGQAAFRAQDRDHLKAEA